MSISIIGVISMCLIKKTLNSHPYRNSRSFMKGDEIRLNDCIALIQSGVVEVSSWPAKGNPITIRLASHNDLLNVGQYTSHIFTALTDCRLSILPLNRFQDCDAARVDQLIAEQESLTKTLLTLSCGTAVDRVEWGLSVMYDKGLLASKTTKTRKDIPKGLCRLLNRLVCNSPETISRALGQIRRTAS